ncbi:hypothetical protein VFPPC_17843 [Pochonia chlamydosporia 170]|uniref:Uncharacterized protein n=1 Tax=Pochonia chlamydosporia 170 TaxID=1380566 RepID=A0A219ARK5_METCM|nr:hypothetical protein VFPPC_17843 [Pochonia chlamydosporia 170]OWT42964.1 hypothetical protein VFPPC_17843 [Pochonia chlamydosporia 170]
MPTEGPCYPVMPSIKLTPETSGNYLSARSIVLAVPSRIDIHHSPFFATRLNICVQELEHFQFHPVRILSVFFLCSLWPWTVYPVYFVP